MAGDEIRAIHRSLRLYTLFASFQAAMFWTPVFFLFFASIVPLRQVFLLEAIYYVAVVATEVPSGYFSDRFGRRRTLLLSSLFLLLSYTVFAVARGFTVLAVAQVFLAMGFAFASGTDTSLHFDLLRAAGREEEYGDRESRIGARVFQATAISALAGGIIAWTTEYRAAYALAAVCAGAALFCVVLIRETATVSEDSFRDSLARQARMLVNDIRHPVLGFLFLFAVLSTVLRHIPYEFFQVYLEDVFVGLGRAEVTPLLTGIHVALTMLIASWAVRYSMPLKRVAGSRAALILTALAQTALIAILLATRNHVVAVIFLLRSSPGSVSRPIVRSEVSPRLPDARRATHYSLQSLVGRLAFSGVLVLFNRLTGGGIRAPIVLGIAIGLIGVATLCVSALRHRGEWK